MEPGRRERIPIALFFSTVVALGLGWYAESDVLVSVWLVLNIVVIQLLLAVGRRYAVLNQEAGAMTGSVRGFERVTETASWASRGDIENFIRGCTMRIGVVRESPERVGMILKVSSRSCSGCIPARPGASPSLRR
ncbi:DUF6185 family protein [Kitasatospora aburaviensis]